MKKLAAIFLSVVLCVSCCACGAKNDGSQAGESGSQSGSQASENSSGDGASQSVESALALLTTVWNNYPEDSKFACFGGSNTKDTVDNAPGKFDMSDQEALNTLLLLSGSMLDGVDEVASVIHMMNANSFTGAAVHVKDGKTDAFAGDIKNAIKNGHFLCGFPEKLVVITVDDYVAYAFGSEDLIDHFKKTVTAQFSSAKVVYDEAVE